MSSLGLAGAGSALIARSNAAAFDTAIGWIFGASVVAIGWLVFTLYWWRWRGAASGATGIPPYR